MIIRKKKEKRNKLYYIIMINNNIYKTNNFNSDSKILKYCLKKNTFR